MVSAALDLDDPPRPATRERLRPAAVHLLASSSRSRRGAPWRPARGCSRSCRDDVAVDDPVDEADALRLARRRSASSSTARRAPGSCRQAAAAASGAVLGDEPALRERRGEARLPRLPKRTSHIIASTNPPPAPTPLTAPMMGLGQCRRWLNSAGSSSGSGAAPDDGTPPDADRARSSMSRPAENARPSPVTTMPTTDGSSIARSIAQPRSSAIILYVNTFSFSGRSNRRVATGASTVSGSRCRSRGLHAAGRGPARRGCCVGSRPCRRRCAAPGRCTGTRPRARVGVPLAVSAIIAGPTSSPRACRSPGCACSTAAS